MTIPDAAREAIVELVRDAMGWREWDNAEIRQEVDDALAVAAPLIARAAVIAELRTRPRRRDDDRRQEKRR